MQSPNNIISTVTTLANLADVIAVTLETLMGNELSTTVDQEQFRNEHLYNAIACRLNANLSPYNV